MPKSKFILIKGTIFPCDILFTTADDNDLFHYIEYKKNYKLTEEEKDKLKFSTNGNGRTTQLLGGQTIIRVKKAKTKIGIDLPNLIHEISHAVYFILTRIGVEHINGSDEVFSYYQAYVLREILDIFEPKSKNKKKGR